MQAHKTNEQHAQTLQKALNLLAEVEIRAKYSEVVFEALKLIAGVGNELLKEKDEASKKPSTL